MPVERRNSSLVTPNAESAVAASAKTAESGGLQKTTLKNHAPETEVKQTRVKWSRDRRVSLRGKLRPGGNRIRRCSIGRCLLGEV